MICGIYKITNKLNGKIYIGQSLDIDKRWSKHKHDAKTKDSHLYRAIRKHGLDNFTFSIICEVPESALDQYEISYIKYYETTNPEKGYNKQTGGANGRHSDETKKKMSDSKKDKKLSDEHKNKISNAKKGKTLSYETKNKISDAKKGKPKSDETKKKMSDAKKNMSDETKKKMSESQIKRRRKN